GRMSGWCLVFGILCLDRTPDAPESGHAAHQTRNTKHPTLNTKHKTPNTEDTMSSRFVVGIDLGTTNSALAYVDTGAGKDAKVTPFPIPQVVAQGSVEDRPLLPSFLYLP